MNSNFLGYSLNVWCLFFSMYRQSKYVIEIESETSFMLPLAEEMERFIKDIMVGKLDIGISQLEKDNIDKLIMKIIPTILNSRKLNPSLLLLASMRYLFEINHSILVKHFGQQIIIDFLDDFHEKIMNSSRLDAYLEANRSVLLIVSSDIIPYAARKKINKFKSTFKTLIDGYSKDGSHGLQHCEDVISRAIEYKQMYNMSNIEYDDIIAFGYIHDMYSETDRKNHHILAGEWIRKSMSPYFKEMGKDRVEMLIKAIEEHRASSGLEVFSSEFSELMATADRGESIDIDSILNRCYKYTLEHYKDELSKYSANPRKKVILKKILNHMIEKFSRNGYIKYPKLFMRRNEKEIESVYKMIDHMIIGTVKLDIVKNKVIIKGRYNV